MGRKADALREGRRATELRPVSRDVIEGAVAEAFLALIYARVGEPDQAIAQITRLLTIPFAVDYAERSRQRNRAAAKLSDSPLSGTPAPPGVTAIPIGCWFKFGIRDSLMISPEVEYSPTASNPTT